MNDLAEHVDPAGAPRPTHLLRIDAGGAADAERSWDGPVSALLEIATDPARAEADRDRPDLDWAGPLEAVEARLLTMGPERPPADLVIDRTGSVLIPGLVNAHTHLDLTAMGYREHDPADGFVPWVRMVIRERPRDRDAIAAAVRRGIELSLAGGVVAVGDISGVAGQTLCTTPFDELVRSPLGGVTYLEWMSAPVPATRAELGRRFDALADTNESLRARGATARVGHSPHAPYTVRPADYAFDDRLPWCTHLAESPAEREFIAAGTGPFREMLDGFGCFDDAFEASVGRGEHPFEAVADGLSIGAPLLVHMNDCPDRVLERMDGFSLAYCPRSSAYFGAPEAFGPHRYREMLDRGVNVCLGTDSIINLRTADRISPLDDARLLFERDGADPRTLLAMLTVNGATALGLPAAPHLFRTGGSVAGVAAVPIEDRSADPAAAVFGASGAAELLLIRIGSRLAGIGGPGSGDTYD